MGGVTSETVTVSDSKAGRAIPHAGLNPASARQDRRPSPPKQLSPSTLSVRKRGQRLARADCRHGVGLIVAPLRMRSRSLGSDTLLSRRSARISRTIQGHDTKTYQPNTSSAMVLQPSGYIVARSRSDTYRHVRGTSSCRCSEASGITCPLAEGAPHVADHPTVKVNNDVLNNRIDLVSDETKIRTHQPSPDPTGFHIEPGRSDHLGSTASRSSKRSTLHNAEHIRSTAQSSVVCNITPSWVDEDGKLYIVCDQNTTAGTYEVDLEAKVRLSLLDAQHCQSFCIPGLIRADPFQYRIPTGGFALYLEPAVDTPGGLPVKFESNTLMNHHTKESSHIIGRFRLNETPRVSVRTKQPVHCVSDFSVAIEACAAFLPGIESIVKSFWYNATISCKVADEDVWADQVEFFIVVRNGPSESEQYHVTNGTCAVHHNAIILSSGAKESETLISVLRNIEDIQNDLDISFSRPVDVSSPKEVFLPTIRPLFGKVLSESIILSLPKLPLKLEHIKNDSHITWNVLQCSEAGHRMMRLNRLAIPDTLAEVMQDNPHFKISELVRVSFKSLRATNETLIQRKTAPVARTLHITLFEILGGQLVCQINIEVEVRQSSKIVKIDPQGWLPYMSYVDGQLATEKHGEWRKTDDALLTLFNTRDVKVGTVMHITLFFQQPRYTPTIEEDFEVIELDRNGKDVEQPLPRIVGKTILQAMVRSELKDCKQSQFLRNNQIDGLTAISRHDHSFVSSREQSISIFQPLRSY